MNKFGLFILLLLLPIVVSASCSNQDLTRYKSLAGNINSYYDYDDGSNRFSITVYNLSSDLMLINQSDSSSYRVSSSGIGELVINNLNPGTNVTLGVYPVGGDCSNYRIRTIYVNLPYYNKYYKDSVCVNNSSSLCSKWANTSSYSYEQFVNSVSEESSIVIEEPDPEPEVSSFSFFEFLGKYYIVILLFIIVSGSIGIYVLDKKSRFDF